MLKVNKIILFLYFFLPIIFYTLPLFFAVDGEILIHFYGNYKVATDTFYHIIVAHAFFGLLIYYISAYKKNFLILEKSNIIVEILFVVSFTVYVFANSYIALIAMPFFIYFPANYKVSIYSRAILIPIAFIDLLFFGERFAILFALFILFFKLISKQHILTLIAISFISTFFLVLVLEPLKWQRVPFSDFETEDTFLAIYSHLNPLYLSAYLSYDSKYTISELIVEIIPFGKSIFDVPGLVEKIGREAMPSDLYATGHRVGSSSMSYYNGVGMTIITMAVLILKILIKAINLKSIQNSILFYVVLHGIYFMRRTIGTYFIDILIIVIIVLFIELFKYLLRNAK